MTRSIDDILRKEQREAAEPWAIGKRLWCYADVPSCVDKTELHEHDGDAVVDERGVVLPAHKTGPRGHSGTCTVIDHDAKDIVPWCEPPDWPGVVAVIHPAAWASTGPTLCEALAKRFAKTVHVFAHGSKWCLVFVGPPGNNRSMPEQAEYDRDVSDGDAHGCDDGGLYSKGNCQWWATISPFGDWKNLAAS